MPRVTITNTAIHIPSPIIPRALARLLGGGLLGAAVWDRFPATERLVTEWIHPVSADWHRAIQTYDAALESTRVVVSGLIWAMATLCAMFAVFSAIRAFYRLLRNGVTDRYTGVPAEIKNSDQVVRRLLADRCIDQETPAPPPVMARLFFGKWAAWMTPPTRPLMNFWSRATLKWPIWLAILAAPAFAPTDWLTNLAAQNQADLNILAVAGQVEAVLAQIFTSYLLVTVAAAWVIVSLSLSLTQWQQPAIHVYEDNRQITNTGNPLNYFGYLRDQIRRLRRGEFPNRTSGEREPRIGTVQPGQTTDFSGAVTVETQPMPVGNGRNLASASLDFGGWLLYLAGFAILLYAPGVAAGPAEIVRWMPSLLAGLVAIRLAGQLIQLGRTQTLVYRFHSDLFWIRLRGTCTASRIGVGDGRGSLLYSERVNIQSDTAIEVLATRLITECVAPSHGGWTWDATGAALRSPRYLIDSCAAPEFVERVGGLMGAIAGYKGSEGMLPEIDVRSLGNIISHNAEIQAIQTRASHAAISGTNSFGPVALPQALQGRILAVSNDSSNEKKPCPDCAELVQAAARICRFCQHQFGEISNETE